MKKGLFSLFSLFLITSLLSPQAPDQQRLKNEIAALEQAIVKTKAESGQYAGGLIKSLLDSRVQILENTKAMLTQRLTATDFGINIAYTIDGKQYIPPANKTDLIKNLEGEALQKTQELADAKAEAARYSGGLVQSLALTKVATIQQHLALLDMKRCLLIYDIPTFAITEGTQSTSSPQSPSEPTAEPAAQPAAEIDKMFTLEITGKRVFEANYDDHLGFDFVLTNNTDKEIRAVRGICIFSDLFNTEILQVGLTLEQNIPPHQSIKNSRYSMELNKFKAEHNRFRSIEMENLKMRFEIKSIIFKDGSVVNR